MYDEKLLSFNIAGISTKKETCGIGGFKSEKIEICDFDDYFLKMAEIELILDYEERKKIIKENIKKCGQLVEEDEDLLEEVTALVEYPTAIFCDFSPKFLEQNLVDRFFLLYV